MFIISSKRIPIGREPVFEKEKENKEGAYGKDSALFEEESSFLLANYDVSLYSDGHLAYRDSMSEILYSIDYEG